MRFRKSPSLSKHRVLDTLKTLKVEDQSVESLLLDDKTGVVTIVLKVEGGDKNKLERARYEVQQAVEALEGVEQARIVLTGEATTSKPQQKMGKPAPAQKLELPSVTSIIAVASAKGGVGKSTVALNLAVSLAKKGLKIGLLDADIYGPSIPTMTDTVNEEPDWKKGEKLKPLNVFGVTVMSIGYLTKPEEAMIWRGPMVMSAISQMIKDVEWGELDVLVIDTPPGTGDAQLTLAQRLSIDGVVLVSTPQEVALADVRRGISLFKKTNIPVLGLVQNMSWFEDPVSGNRTYVFGEGGAEDMANELDIALLGNVPLITNIRTGGDVGRPVTANDAPGADAFHEITEAVLISLAKTEKVELPDIVFE